jgi:DNA-binding NarL/FixJ family response regulator
MAAVTHNATTVTRTCIVADDEPGVRQFVARVLAAMQFDVIAAGGGREATTLLASRGCDLLITDLAMPGGEGIETIRGARRQYPTLKILAISGAFGKEMLRTAEILGANASLSKPFTAEQLTAAVQSLFDTASP